MRHRTKFHLWLLKKYETKSLSEAVQKFTSECKPAGSLSHNTVLKWADGSKPRKLPVDIYGPQFPDCPLFSVKSHAVPQVVESQPLQQ